MKKLLVILLSLLIFNISSAQSGWGYVNYTSYKTHNGNGSQNQYGAFPYTAAEFDNMLNTANSNTTITHTGEVPLATMCNGSTGTPHWGGDYYAIKFEFWFVPQETGTYRFGINSDDASDISVNGNIISTYYGGHGASGYQIGSINLVAGTYYKIIARYQEFGGGDVLYVSWSRPSSPNTYSFWVNEVTNIGSSPSKKAIANFDFGNTIDKTQFSVGGLALNSSGQVIITTLLDSIKVNSQYKPQSITMTTTNILSTLYSSIITVSDVYAAFKELANGGIFGNQKGNEFVYGIQYKNADINDDNVFDESDCFKLLQHLTGVKNIVDTFNLNKTIKLIPQTTYTSIGKLNWNTFLSYLGSTYNFDINTGKATDTLNVLVTWKGDVNLSHSPTPPSNGLTTSVVKLINTSVSNNINASIITELSDKVYAYITLDPLQQEVVGTQFHLNYDNTVLKFESIEFKTKGSPINYGTDKNNYINLGSLVNDGSTILDNTTEYKVTFTPIVSIDNVLGLISIGATDAVNKAGAQLKVKVN